MKSCQKKVKKSQVLPKKMSFLNKIANLFTSESNPAKFQNELLEITNFDQDLYVLPHMFKKYWKFVEGNMKELKSHPTIYNLLEKIKVINIANDRINPDHLDQLAKCLNEFFGPKVNDFIVLIAETVLNTQKIFGPREKTIFCLQDDKIQEVVLSGKECFCLLVNMFVGTLVDQRNQNFSKNFVFRRLYTSKTKRLEQNYEKLKCLLNYFKLYDSKIRDSSIIKITRKVKVLTDLSESFWRKSEEKMESCNIMTHKRIEDFPRTIQIDFANKYIGGGVLGEGCLQEEITFITSPETLVSLLFCAKMEDNCAITIQGADIFSEYQGYAATFQFKESYGRLPISREGQIIAIDALDFSQRSDQFSKSVILRELNKAYIGFSEESNQTKTVTTGLWGCGGFQGDKEIKFVVQWLAASQSKLSINFIDDFITPLQNAESLVENLKSKSLGDIFELFLEAVEKKKNQKEKIFDYMISKSYTLADKEIKVNIFSYDDALPERALREHDEEFKMGGSILKSKKMFSNIQNVKVGDLNHEISSENRDITGSIIPFPTSCKTSEDTNMVDKNETSEKIEGMKSMLDMTCQPLQEEAYSSNLLVAEDDESKKNVPYNMILK